MTINDAEAAVPPSAKRMAALANAGESLRAKKWLSSDFPQAERPESPMKRHFLKWKM